MAIQDAADPKAKERRLRRAWAATSAASAARREMKALTAASVSADPCVHREPEPAPAPKTAKGKAKANVAAFLAGLEAKCA